MDKIDLGHYRTSLKFENIDVTFSEIFVYFFRSRVQNKKMIWGRFLIVISVWICHKYTATTFHRHQFTFLRTFLSSRFESDRLVIRYCLFLPVKGALGNFGQQLLSFLGLILYSRSSFWAVSKWKDDIGTFLIVISNSNSFKNWISWSLIPRRDRM